jgi:hypothetical protein
VIRHRDRAFDKPSNTVGVWAIAAICGCVMGTASAAEAEMPRGVIQLDETVISGNQELPKVLYIVPWQQPDGLPEIELHNEFAEADLFRRLYPPAHRRELAYFDTARQADAADATTADATTSDSSSDAKE